MKSSRYILRSFKYYFKQHLSVLLGTLLSTAVITGALIVGDSVKFSLNKLTEKRLGSTEYALQGGERFFTDSLAVTLAQNDELMTASLLHLSAMAIEPDQDKRIHEVNVYGVDSSFNNFSNDQIGRIEKGCWISENISARLNLKIGQELLIKVENIDIIPVNTPFVQEKESSLSIRIKLTKILSDEEFARFSLQSNQKAPFNIFIDRSFLQNKLNLLGKSNLLLAKHKGKILTDEEVQNLLSKEFSINDAGLSTKKLEDQDIYEISSERVFIDEEIVDEMSGVGGDNLLTYLVNSIKNKENKETPYSFVSALDQNLLPYTLKDDEIIINDWCANDLGLFVGDSLTLEYFVIGAYRRLDTVHKSFIIKAIEINQGDLFKKDLMPDFPGLSDAKSCNEWDTGIPIDLDKIRDKDEAYWDEFKGTPKGIINYKSGLQLWANAFGSATSIRMEEDLKGKWMDSFNSKILPENLGLRFINVSALGKSAASNSVDFAELFLSLSFFVILAAILLIILLYSLNIHARKSELLKLKALGIRRNKIFKLYFSEIFISILLGSLLGALAGIFYNQIILKALNGLWQDAVRTQALEMYISYSSLLIGFISGLLISLVTVYLVLRSYMKEKKLVNVERFSSKRKLSIYFRISFILIAVAFISYLVNLLYNKSYLDQSAFMMAGAMFLLLLILGFNFILRQWKKLEEAGFGILPMVKKYLATNSKRSMLAISFLALGIFSVILTGANRKTFANEYNNTQGPTGGYLFWMDTAFPLIHDPNAQKGREVYGYEDENFADSISFLPLLTLNGDDASCLNLNQVQNPQILGVDPNVLHARNSFSFVNPGEIDMWKALDREYDQGVIPAYIDQTVITWGLMKKVGDTLIYHDENGYRLDVIIAGALANTIFQGNVLVSEKNMRKYFPSVAGAKVCLIDAKPEQMYSCKEFLDFHFRDYGVDYTLTTERLAEFNSVNNTYLNVFMMLGALGILIGTIGFGIILLRNKQERKSENALMSALGIKRSTIRRIFILEHLTLLLVAILIAVFAGSVAIIPSLVTPVYELPILFLMFLLFLILLSGIVWILLFSAIGKSAHIIRDLRSE